MLKPEVKKCEGGGYNLSEVNNFFTPNFPNLKIIEMDDTDTNKIMAKLKTMIPECCNATTTYYDVLKAISKNFTEPVYIIGGCVRDYMITKDVNTMNDIDINYTILPEEVENLLIEPLQIKTFYKDERNYIRIGPKSRSDYLEGFYIIPTSYSEYSLESKMNSLLFLIESTKIFLIDLFGGESLSDAKSKIWSSPTEDYSKWMGIKKTMLWRMLKFELRGYTVPFNTKKAVYNYWLTSDISDYDWQNIWWTLDPTKLKEIIELIKNDCIEVDINYGDLLQLFIKKGLLISNKV
jgi:hypothetical protein